MVALTKAFALTLQSRKVASFPKTIGDPALTENAALDTTY